MDDESDVINRSALRAVDFSAKIHMNQRQLSAYNPERPNMNALNFRVSPQPNMEFFSKRLFDFQETHPGVVDIGFHYAKEADLARIRESGLRTRTGRVAEKPSVSSDGIIFGKGIYTANNPYSYHAFGGAPVGLFVARLKARTADFAASASTTANTIVAHSGQTDEVCSHKDARQCVVLAEFYADMVDIDALHSFGNDMVHDYQKSLQAIVDECFNDGRHTPVPKLRPTEVSLRRLAVLDDRVVAVPRDTVYEYDTAKARTVQDGSFHATEKAEEVECSICLDSVEGDWVKLMNCSHLFHRSCIVESLKVNHRCPMCRSDTRHCQGNMPSGTMRVRTVEDLACSGHNPSVIVITYDMQGGIQNQYHENPGVAYNGTSRVAYLPNCPASQSLLRRLVYAFEHGLTFVVQTNTTTWGPVSHKSSLVDQGPCGWPDPSYFARANAELNDLNVPSAKEL